MDIVILSDNADTVGVYPREVFDKAVSEGDINLEESGGLYFAYSELKGYNLQVEFVTIAGKSNLMQHF